MKIKDLGALANPDNLTVIYFSGEGLTVIEQSLAELVDKINEELRAYLLPSADEVVDRLLELGIILELQVQPELEGNTIKMDYTFEDIDHAIWFNISEPMSTVEGYLTFTFNAVEKPIYLGGAELETPYINSGYYLIVYSKSLKTYNLTPILPKDLGFINTKKYASGIFTNLLEIDDYNFLYVTDNYVGDTEESLFCDLPESLLFNTLSYTLKIVKTKISNTPLSGYTQIYSVIKNAPQGITLNIPTENIFIPKSQAFYLYKN